MRNNEIKQIINNVNNGQAFTNDKYNITLYDTSMKLYQVEKKKTKGGFKKSWLKLDSVIRLLQNL